MQDGATVGSVKGSQAMKGSVNAVPARGGWTSILVVTLILGLAGRLTAFEFEYWPKAIVRVGLDDDWQLGLEEWITFPDNGRRFRDTQTDIWLNYFGLADWLCVGSGYKQVYAKTDDGWCAESRPMLDLAARTKVYGFGVSDRSRFEFRFPQDQDFVTRYRNRLTITSPVTFTPLKIEPYTAEEVFINFDEQGFNQNRIYGGVFIPLHEKVRLELFYIWKLDKTDDGWCDTNVIGSWVYVQF